MQVSSDFNGWRSAAVRATLLLLLPICLAQCGVIGGGASADDKSVGSTSSGDPVRQAGEELNGGQEPDDRLSLERRIDEADVIDAVVATIDGEPLTSGELKRFVSSQARAGGAAESAASPAEPRSAQQQLRDLVTSRLLEKEASKLGISVSESEIGSYISEVKRRNGVEDSQFVTLLSQQGMTVEEYRKQVAADILKSRVVTSRVRSRISIVDEDLQRFAAEHPELVPKAGQLHLHQLFFPATGSASSELSLGDGQLLEGSSSAEAAARAAAEAARDSVKDGRSFASAGGEYSDLGFIQVNDLRDDFQSALEKTKVGGVSEPILSTQGVYLLFVSEESVGGVLSKEVAEQVKQQLFQVKFREELDRYLNDELPKKYDVEMLM